MTDKPTRVKISLGDRRKLVDEIAEAEKRSVSETVCLLLDIFFKDYEQIKQSAAAQNRNFIDMAKLWGRNTSSNQSVPEIAELVAPKGEQILGEIAAEEKTTLNEVVYLLVDLVLSCYAGIRESAEIKNRTFFNTLELWVQKGESGESAAAFLKAIASGRRLSDASCIKVARELDLDPEEIIRLRNCVKEKQLNGK